MPDLFRLEKRSFSVYPWRLVHIASGRALPGASFARKRDGLPVLQAVLACCTDVPATLPWEEWPEDVRLAISALVATCPGSLLLAAALGRSRLYGTL